jgi:hypothetical protein
MGATHARNLLDGAVEKAALAAACESDPERFAA